MVVYISSPDLPVRAGGSVAVVAVTLSPEEEEQARMANDASIKTARAMLM